MPKPKLNYRLQGHEKFIFRDGWMFKGLKEVNRNPLVFRTENTPDLFGMGTNMVKSMRYWLKACDLIEEKGIKGTYLTPFGKIIMEEDPYLEDLYTVSLLHWHLVCNRKDATSWFVLFHKCRIQNMNKEEISFMLSKEMEKLLEGEKVAEKSLKNDVDILLRMYEADPVIKDPEDKNHSAFSDLRLMKQVGKGGFTEQDWQFSSLSYWLALFVIEKKVREQSGISFEELIEGEGGLRPVFHMTMMEVTSTLDKLEAMGLIKVVRTAGLDMIYKTTAMSEEEIIRKYYSSVRSESVWGR